MKILIVGMARSGTTFVSHFLGLFPNVHVEVEPHALWRTGNFQFLDDETYITSKTVVSRIREKLCNTIGSKILVEKSPINSLRPGLVSKVFPDAKVVYLIREPLRCIESNLNRSLLNDSFKFSIILKKYLRETGTNDLKGAKSNRSIFKQLSLIDYPWFIVHTLRMLHLRNKGLLPFGPKLVNFDKIVKEKGLIYYHCLVYKKSMEYLKEYQQLYGDKLKVFKMEELMQNEESLNELLAFCELTDKGLSSSELISTLNQNRIKKATRNSKIDLKIIETLKELGIEHDRK